ncbi:MAG TPA: hypothetical protein VEI97_00385 [bacterium]|nr:hypothetical protein [bacterium]
MSDGLVEKEPVASPAEPSLTKAAEVPTSEDSTVPTDVLPPGLRDLPPEQRQIIQSFTAMMMSGPMAHPLAKVINADHINKMIDASDSANKRESDRKRDELGF